eukprot:1425540-Amphidinium_carterae.1
MAILCIMTRDDKRENVLDHFESLGYRCPARQDVADYLQEVTTQVGAQFLMSPEELKTRGITPPRTTDEFAMRWMETKEAKAMEVNIASPHPPHVVLEEFQQKYAQHWARSMLNCSKVFLILLRRDPKALLAQLIGNLLVGAVVALLFTDLGLDDVQSKLGLIFLTTTNFGLMSAGSMADAFTLRAVFYKHRDANFYPSAAFAIAQTLACLPATLGNVACFAPIVYWTTGLSQDKGEHFVYYVSICVLLDLAMGQFFRVLAATLASYDAAVSMASVCILFMTTFSGFVFAPTEIPVVWVWIYYLNPFTYAFAGLAHNELRSE